MPGYISFVRRSEKKGFLRVYSARVIMNDTVKYIQRKTHRSSRERLGWLDVVIVHEGIASVVALHVVNHRMVGFLLRFAKIKGLGFRSWIRTGTSCLSKFYGLIQNGEPSTWLGPRFLFLCRRVTLGHLFHWHTCL